MQIPPRKKRTRTILFFGLIGFFLIGAPILVAYSLGYTVDLTGRTLYKIGGIFVKSHTARISIFLDNALVRETSLLSVGGALLTNVTPGFHQLRVEKSGYQPWSKRVWVEPAVVTELRNILLVPHAPTGATSTPAEVAPLLAESSTSASPLTLGRNGILVDRRRGTEIASGVGFYAGFDEAAVFIDANGFLARANLLAEPEVAIEVLGRPGFHLDPKKPPRFFSGPRGELVVLDSSGGAFLVESAGQIRLLESGVEQVLFDENGEKFLLAKERALRLVWLVENPRQPFQPKYILETIWTSDSLLREAAWFFKGNAHIVVRTNEGVFLVELDGRGGRNTTTLIPDRVDQILTTPKFKDHVFFRQDQAWFKIEI